MPSAEIERFEDQYYLNLETFRKNGEGVLTPVWFVRNGAMLFVRTLTGSGKVRRVQANPHVRVVPCTLDGEPLGRWLNADAWLMLPGPEMDRVNGLLARKYGLDRDFHRRFGIGSLEESTVIAILLRD